MGRTKPTLYDIIQDQREDASDVFQQSAGVISPVVANSKMQLDAAPSAPSTPAADKIRFYATAIGATPNKTIKFAYKTEQGDEVIFSTMIV